MSDKKAMVSSVENSQLCTVKLPIGELRYTCCAECSAGEYDAVKEMVWCGKFRHWYNGSDGCSQGPDK